MSMEQRLTDLRKEKGVTQNELADELVLSRYAVVKWENGTAAPSAENLKRLSEYYGVTVDYLLCGRIEELKPEPEPEPAPVEVPAEPAKPKSNRMWKIIAGVAAGILALLLVVGIWLHIGAAQRAQGPDVPIEDMKKEEQVSPVPDSGFDLGL